MTNLTESHIEHHAISLLQKLGYKHLNPEDQENERSSLTDVILKDRLRDAVDRLNPDIPVEAKQQAINAVMALPTQNLIENNAVFQVMLSDGVAVEYQHEGQTKGDQVLLIDFNDYKNNDFVVCDQFTVHYDKAHKRPDLVLFVNGLPLVIIELKNASDEKATVDKAFQQLQNYKTAIPSLFEYNGLLIASDGFDARYGSLTASRSRFMHWKTSDGKREAKITTPELETLAKGMLNREVLLDLVKNFTVFEKTTLENKETGQTTVELVKKVAAYHQYYAVKKAVYSTLRASGMVATLSGAEAGNFGNRKAGVVWHTQGSGKSLSMVFYAGKIVGALENPTVVVITDRNDLDEQLFQTFAGCQNLLRQKPVQATSRADLKKLLKTTGGGIIFTTIQKFSPEDRGEEFEELSNRSNIVVMADEAHRSQYGFAAKTNVKGSNVLTTYGYAKYLRDAIPNASFIGFTGTPIEKEDASTPAVFGEYIDVYDIQQAVEDGATVRIFYESRLAKVHLKPEEKSRLDAEVEAITESEESTAADQAKIKWTQLEAIVGHKERLKSVAEDIINHFEARMETFEGKGMIVSMSRRVAVALYEEIINLRPEWENHDLMKGEIKVVMTSSSSDPANWQPHHTTKQDRKVLAARLRDPADPLKLVIVRDMWLTGFDAPCLNTMYIDKTMRGHNLMQAIARVNRVYKDKDAGLVVDYIGIATDLKHALATYTESGGKGKPTFDVEEAVLVMEEKFEVIMQMFSGFDYQRYFTADTGKKLGILLEAADHILGLERGKDRYVKEVIALSKAYALCASQPKAIDLKEEIAFFQAVKARLVKFEPQGTGKSDAEIETAIRQIIDQAVVSEGVMDIFDAAGIKKPDISILSDEFLDEIKGMENRNLAVELLNKLLNDEVKVRSKRNMIQSKKLSEMLEAAIKRYHNNMLTSVQILEEMIKIAKEIRSSDKRVEEMGLTFDEAAFYDALAENNSALEVLGDETLRDLAHILVDKVRKNATIDWTIKESVKAKLRTLIKRTLRKYGYPPDQQEIATENILEQARLFAEEWSE